MNWKTLVVLLVLAAGLGGFYAYDTYRLTPAREKAEQAKGKLWEVEPKDIESIAIARKGETLRVRRVESGWEVVEPIKARGDRATLDGVATTLATLRVDRELDANPAKPADFGLDVPVAEVTLEVKGRKEPLGVAVGGKSPTGAWVYGRERGKTAVLAFSESVLRDVTRPVADFRDKAVITFDRKSVTGLELGVEGGPVALESPEAGKWQMVRPRPYKADGDAVSEFLDKLDAARVKEFVEDAPASLAPYGLDKPTDVTVVLGRDKERSTRTLQFGKVDAAKKGVYVMRAGERSVLLVPDELWTAVPKTPAVLRDKVVVTYAYDKVTKLQLHHPRGDVTVERDGSGWKITAPEALAADTGSVNAVLWKVRDLRASGFLADDATGIARYLAKPQVTVALWEEGAKVPKTLLVGPSAEVRGGAPAAVAALAGEGPVALVDGKTIDDLAKTADDLRDKRLLPAFELSAVKRARVTVRGKAVVVERTGETEWRVLEPTKGAARESNVTNLLLGLKALRWKEIAAAKPGDLAPFGLDKPEAEVTLQKDGGDLATLSLGKQEGELVYVRLKDGPVYKVEARHVEDVRKAPADLPGGS